MNITILGKYLISSAMEKPRRGWGLRIEGNRIREVGPNETLCAKHRKGELLDSTTKIIMPGFVNPHMHMFSTLAQGMPCSTKWGEVIEWLMGYWWPEIEDKADKESIRASTALSAARMIHSGITTVCDVMETPYALPGCLDVAGEIMDRAGLRAVLAFEASERIGPENGQLGLEENARFIRHNPSRKGRLSGMVCTHTTFTCSLPFLKSARKLADRLESGIRMHASESRHESLHCLRTYGMLPFEVYDSIGFLKPDVLASLVIHVRDREVALAAKRGLKIAHIPRASANPGCGVAPVPSFLAQGMIVGISPYPSFDPFETLRATQLIHRAHWVDSGLLPANQLLAMMTLEAARAIGLEDVGALKEGMLADVILVDGEFIVPATEQNVLDLIISSRDPEHIDTVIVDGQFVMRDGVLLTLDLGQLEEDARRASLALWERNQHKLD